MLLCAIVRGLLLGAAVAAQSTPAPPSTSTPTSTSATLSVAPAAYREYTTNVTHDSPLLGYTGEWAAAGTTQCPGHLAATAGASVQISWVGRGLSFIGGVAAGTSLTFTVDDQPAQPYGTGAAGVITGTVGLEYAHHTATLTLANGVICLSSVTLTVLQQTSSDTDQVETFMAVPGGNARRKRFRFRLPHLIKRQESGNAVAVPANTTLLQIYGTPASGGDTSITLSPAPPLGAPATMTIPASTASAAGAAAGGAPLLYMAPLDPSVTYSMSIDSPAAAAGAQAQPWQIDFHKGAKVDGDPPAAGVTVPVLAASPASADDTTNPAPAADPGAAAAGGATAADTTGDAAGTGADAEPKPAPAADPDAAAKDGAATGGADATDAPAATGDKTDAASAASTSKTSKDGKDGKDSKDGDKSKDSANSGSGHSPNRAGIIAGSVLGALAGLILLGILFWWMMRRPSRRSPRGRQRASSVWGPRSPMWSSKKQYFTDIPDAPPVPDIPSMYQPNMAGAGAVGGMHAGPGMGMGNGMGAGAGVIRGLGPRGSGGSSIEELHSNESHGQQRGNGNSGEQQPFEADSRYPESVSPTPADHPFNNVVRKPVNPFETPFDDPTDAPSTAAASGVNPHPQNSGLRVLPPPIIPPVPVLSPMMQGRRTPSVPNSPMSPVPPPRASVRHSRSSQPGSRREPRRSQLVVTNRTPPATPPPHAPITSFPGASFPPTPPPMHPPPPPPVSGPIRSTTPLKLHNRSRSRKVPSGKYKSGTSSTSPGYPANANRVRSQRKTALQSLYDLYGGDEEYVESEYSQDDRRDTRAHLHDSAWWSRPSSTNTEFVSNLIDARTRGSVAPALRQVARNASQRRLV